MWVTLEFDGLAGAFDIQNILLSRTLINVLGPKYCEKNYFLTIICLNKLLKQIIQCKLLKITTITLLIFFLPLQEENPGF